MICQLNEDPVGEKGVSMSSERISPQCTELPPKMTSDISKGVDRGNVGREIINILADKEKNKIKFLVHRFVFSFFFFKKILQKLCF